MKVALKDEFEGIILTKYQLGTIRIDVSNVAGNKPIELTDGESSVLIRCSDFRVANAFDEVDAVIGINRSTIGKGFDGIVIEKMASGMIRINVANVENRKNIELVDGKQNRWLGPQSSSPIRPTRQKYANAPTTRRKEAEEVKDVEEVKKSKLKTADKKSKDNPYVIKYQFNNSALKVGDVLGESYEIPRHLNHLKGWIVFNIKENGLPQAIEPVNGRLKGLVHYENAENHEGKLKSQKHRTARILTEEDSSAIFNNIVKAGLNDIARINITGSDEECRYWEHDPSNRVQWKLAISRLVRECDLIKPSSKFYNKENDVANALIVQDLMALVR